MFADRRSTPAFWLESLFVVIGVLLRLPMFIMARSMDYHLAGMPMGGAAARSARAPGRRMTGCSA